jgi:formylglycine-generating enzyme required for sulfatase activity
MSGISTFGQAVQQVQSSQVDHIEIAHKIENGSLAIVEIKSRIGSLEISMVRIPAGTFRMGSSAGAENEKPIHTVTLSHAFWMGKYPVTQAQFEAVMGRNPSNWKRPDNPVNQVTWDDAQAFVARLNTQQDGFVFHLPTEAEWEYACRAGTTGETYGNLKNIAWYGHAMFGSIHPVGQKAPNAFGLYDMLGNVVQWCQDFFGPYSADDQTDPQGPTSGELRLVRGGSFIDSKSACRAPLRRHYAAGYRYRDLGFRVVAIEGR